MPRGDTRKAQRARSDAAYATFLRRRGPVTGQSRDPYARSAKADPNHGYAGDISAKEIDRRYAEQLARIKASGQFRLDPHQRLGELVHRCHLRGRA